MLPIGVCSWSIDRLDPLRALQVSAQELQLQTIQLGFFTREVIARADLGAISRTTTEHNVSICGTFVAFEGEDYSSIDSIGRTGGLMPDDAYAGRMDALRSAATITAAIAGAAGERATRDIAIHLGTIPSNPQCPDYAKLVSRARELADVCQALRLRLLLETGREAADMLLGFISALQRENVAVSFDPANFVIYGTDDPVKSILQLKSLIGLVHLKDATRPAVRAGGPPASLHAAGASRVFGSPAAFGQGEVQIPRVVSKLRAAGYGGPLLIETPERAGLNAIREAARFLQSMF